MQYGRQIRDFFYRGDKEMNLPFPILRNETCLNQDCQNRVAVSVDNAKVAWQLLMLRIGSLICIACLVGASASLMMFPVMAQPQPNASPNEVLQQFEIQDNSAEILRLRIIVEKQAGDIATMQGIGIGLGCILLVLQVAQIAVGRGIRGREGARGERGQQGQDGQ